MKPTLESRAMKPIECYRDIASRANRFLYLHDDLINARGRRANRSWCENFKQFMNWPSRDEIERVDSANAMVVIRPGSQLTPDDFSASALDDFLRMAIVLGVSALDRYVHERVCMGVVAALRKPKLNRQQEEFSMPAELALSMLDTALAAKRRGEQVRPANEMRNRVQEHLHTRPFQSWRELEYAFALLGVKNLSGQMQELYKIRDIQPIKQKLGAIVSKRNFIVHEGDLKRHKKGGTIQHQDIGRGWVEESLEFLDEFVSNLDGVS